MTETAWAVRGRADAPMPSRAAPGIAKPFLSQVTRSFFFSCVVLVEIFAAGLPFFFSCWFSKSLHSHFIQTDGDRRFPLPSAGLVRG